MAFKDDYDFEFLKNEAENLVLNELEHQLNNYDEPVCRCNECIVDMAAISLNNVKPLYRVSLLGTLYAATAKDEEKYAEEIRNAVAAGIKKVHNNPGHELHSDSQ
jgi:competence protein ComFB